MKARFKEWLISLNEIAMNELGIDEMLTHLDDELNIINGNECEQEILNNLVPAYGPQNDVTLKMPAFEWVHVQLHQQKGMISLSPPTICNSAQPMLYCTR